MLWPWQPNPPHCWDHFCLDVPKLGEGADLDFPMSGECWVEDKVEGLGNGDIEEEGESEGSIGSGVG